MSRINQITSQLEAVAQAIDTLDADLAAGRLDRDDHRRRQAEHEREGGRLFVDLRRAQREAEGPRPGEAPATVGWRQSPPMIVAIGSLLLVVGVGAGVVGSGWSGGRQAVGPPVAAPAPSSRLGTRPEVRPGGGVEPRHSRDARGLPTRICSGGWPR